MKKFRTNRFGKKIRIVNQEEIVDFIKYEPGCSENEIMESVYGYIRNATWESNKKYADCLRRALHSGKIRREEIKYHKHKFIYFINDIPKVEPKKDIVYSSQIKNDNMSKELKVTTELKKVLLDLGYISKDNNTIFSDPRCKKQAVGVKVCRLFLNENQVRSVIIKMGELGFELVNYKSGIKYIANPWKNAFSGDRFTFYKHSPNKAKKDNVYSSQIKSKNMNQIKIEGKLEMINLSAPVELGDLKVNLIAQVIVVKGKIDCIEFVDIEKQTYRGIEISDWKKFVNMNKEWGMDYNKVLNEKFEEIFKESVVKEILGLGK